jgi:hypothetical protein
MGKNRLFQYSSTKIGPYVYSLATVAMGVINLIWGDFEAGHQPIQAFGDHIPGREIFAYIAAAWLIAGGAAILLRQTAKWGAVALAVIYFIFAIFWLPRFYTVIPILGLRADVYIGLLTGVFEQLLLVAAAIIVYADLVSDRSYWRQHVIPITRFIFGIGSVVFGLAHLTGVQSVAALVPAWIPLGGKVWTITTGIAFLLAGAAILTHLLDILASRLLAVMLLVFSALVLLPSLFDGSAGHVAWGSNACNLAVVGAVWMFSELLKGYRRNLSNQV